MPGNDTEEVTDEMVGERRYITRALSEQFRLNNELPKDEIIGITKFPDKYWEWHPFYWDMHMKEKLVPADDVRRYRNVLLCELQIDDNIDERDEGFTCRSILNSNMVAFLMDRLVPKKLKINIGIVVTKM
jgi:hypothetical protein